MKFLEAELVNVVESIWDLILGLSLKRIPLDLVHTKQERTLEACVQITGSWRGALVIHCSADLASQLAATMFELDPEKATIEEIQDTLGELANMTSGNIKAFLPTPSYLSLPVVAEGKDYSLRIPRSRVLTQITFECQGHTVLFSLLDDIENPDLTTITGGDVSSERQTESEVCSEYSDPIPRS